jgi:hydrogenase maturation protein HypF
MDDLRTLQAFAATADQLRKVTGVDALQLAADAHPGYRSSNWARRNAGSRPVHPVQHHHAHLASLMVEHGLDGRIPVIGFAFDGTGFGTDGAIWGGELLIANYHGFRRFAQLDYVPLPGGDAAVARPYRMALAHLHAAGLAWNSELAPVRACPPDERRVLEHQLRTGLGCVPTSSMGRLFDAVSSLAGVRQVADYEAQAAIELEGLSRGVNSDAPYRYQLRADGGVGVAPVISSVVHDVTAGLSAALISARFHAGTIALVHDLAVRARHELDLHTVALTGGVFQNAALLAGACAALRSSGFTVLRHQIVPPNDGGLALGQLVVAAATSAAQGGQSCA